MPASTADRLHPPRLETASRLKPGPKTLPLLMPALVSAFLVAFTLSFDEFAIASFLSRTQQTWPVYLFAQLRVPRLLPQLIAVSSVVFVASLLLILFPRRSVAGSPSGGTAASTWAAASLGSARPSATSR